MRISPRRRRPAAKPRLTAFSALSALSALACFLLLPAAALAAAPMDDSELLLLINKQYTIAASYEAADLTPLNGYPAVQLRAEAAAAYKRMMDAAAAAGFDDLYPRSGYRSYATQGQIFSSRVAMRLKSGMSRAKAEEETSMYNSRPGTSEHQAGLAIDIINKGGSLNASFGKTAASKWLCANCVNYGFILRYAADKVDITRYNYEPWHFRYLGAPHAQIVTDLGVSYEEYIALLKSGSVFERTRGDGLTYLVRYSSSPPDDITALRSWSSDNTGGYVLTYLIDPRDEQQLARYRFAALLANSAAAALAPDLGPSFSRRWQVPLTMLPLIVSP